MQHTYEQPNRKARPTGKSYCRSRGFTLIELGIVIGVMAVLTISVFVGRGMVLTARLSGTLEVMDNLREASRAFAMRRTGGASFTGINLTQLKNDLIIPNPFMTPFGQEPAIIPVADPFGQLTAVRIGVCVDTPLLAEDLVRMITSSPGIHMGAPIGQNGACPAGSVAPCPPRAGALPDGTGCGGGTSVTITTR